MFKRLQKLLVTAIALTLICSFSVEMFSMASGFGLLGYNSFGGEEKREIPIYGEPESDVNMDCVLASMMYKFAKELQLLRFNSEILFP